MKKSNPTIKDILIAAREKIADPAHWMKDKIAVDGDGKPCQVKDGVQFCLWGALEAGGIALDADFANFAVHAENAIMDSQPQDTRRSIIELNDRPSSTHAEVLAVLDNAIESEECGY